MLSLLLPGQLFSFDVWDLKRRKQQTEDELGYFFYPLVYTVPGIGSGNGAGGTILNLLGDGSTLNLIQIRGDYEVDAVAATGMPVFTPRLNLALAYAHGRKGAFSFYGRGPDSTETPEFTLKFKDSYGYGAELSMNFFHRQLVFYAGYAGLSLKTTFEPAVWEPNSMNSPPNLLQNRNNRLQSFTRTC